MIQITTSTRGNMKYVNLFTTHADTQIQLIGDIING